MNLPQTAADQKALLNAVQAGNVLTVRSEGSERVLVLMAGQPLFDSTPEAALDAAAVLKKRASECEEGSTVLFQGRALPAHVAATIAGAMVYKANTAIEQRPKVAEKIALDSAILLRAGLGHIGLSDNPKILDMARVEAESNRDLRRYMPGGIKSDIQLGTPAVSHASDSVESLAAAWLRLNGKKE